MLKRKPLFLFALILMCASPVAGQDAYTLQEAMEYAVKNHQEVKMAELDSKSANAQVGEIRAIGLPQVSGQVQYLHNIEVQSQFLPSNAFTEGIDFGGFFAPLADPSVNAITPEQLQALQRTFDEAPTEDPSVQATAFGVDHMGTAQLDVSQLLFDGSYIIGLRAAKTYKELTKKQANQTKRDVAYNTARAYYGALVAEERVGLLDANIKRLDSLLRDTKILNQEGFAEDIDVKRLEVQVNNLKSERAKIDRLVELSKRLLNFQMGREVNAPIVLSDSLTDASLTELPDYENVEVPYQNRIEYNVLETQKALALLDVQSVQATRIPNLVAFGQGGYNIGALQLSDWFRFQDWQSYAVVGVSLNVPIFSGFQKTNQLQQKRIAVEQVDNGFEQLKNGMDLEAQQAATNLENALKELEIQKDNMALAEEVARVSNIKYKEGVGSNLEVTNAESDYQEARTNYFDALYDVLLYKLELERAYGKFEFPEN